MLPEFMIRICCSGIVALLLDIKKYYLLLLFFLYRSSLLLVISFSGDIEHITQMGNVYLFLVSCRKCRNGSGKNFFLLTPKSFSITSMATFHISSLVSYSLSRARNSFISC